VVHYVALKQALELGLKLTKIHRVIKFNQSPWLRPYIEMNNLLRRGAQNDFEDGFFKDMVNIIHGKMMEQVRERLRVQLALSEEEVRKLVASPAFLDAYFFSLLLYSARLKFKRIFAKSIGERFTFSCILIVQLNFLTKNRFLSVSYVIYKPFVAYKL
jgi:hypothetical protein